MVLNDYSCDCCQQDVESILPIEQALHPVILCGEPVHFCDSCYETYDFSGIYNPLNACIKKPTFDFNPNDKLFGVEWELNSKFDEDDTTISIEHLAHIKEFFSTQSNVHLHWDQSIDGDGIEAVFSPKSLTDNIVYFSELGKSLKKIKGHIGNLKDCGVHIHVSKNHFSTLDQMQLFMLLFHVNKEYCYQVAGRISSFYARLEDLTSLKDFKIYQQCYIEKSNNHKTAGVHAENLNTIEVRIFKSTKNVQDIIRYLNFTKFMIKKTHQIINLAHIDYNDLILSDAEKNYHKK